MQASVTGEIRWRLGLYDKVFELCRAGDFSYARFLALMPDRLRLARGASRSNLEIPVGVDPAVMAGWTQRSSVAGAEAAGPLPSTRDALRRWLRLAQVHPNINPLQLHGWLSSGAEPLLNSLARVHGQGMAEVGRGQGGLQTAYLCHLGLLVRLAEALGPSPGAMAVVLAELLPLGWHEAAQHMSSPEGLPARLGYQMALTTNLPALGLRSHQWQSLPVNPRRTLPEAVQMVAKIIAEPVETLPLARIVSTVSRRLLAEPRLTVALLKDQLAEQVRDAALLLLARTYDPERAADVEPLLTMVSSAQELTRAQYHHGRRQDVLTWLQEPTRRSHRAAGVLISLLQGAEQVATGDSAPLGVHADLPGRAQLAAQGALVAGLDTYTQTLLEDVTRLMVWVPQELATSVYEAGQAYRLADDGSPIHLLGAEQRQAALHLDLSMALGAQPPAARAAAARLDRDLVSPIMRRVRAEPALTEASLCMHHVSVLGPITEVLELAQDVLMLSEAWASPPEAPVREVLGGGSEQDTLREAEIERLDQRIGAVEAALNRADTQPGQRTLLSDSRALLIQQRELLTDIIARRTVRASEDAAKVQMAVTYGEVAEGGDSVWVSQTLTEAAALARPSMGVDSGPASGALHAGCLVTPRALGAYERARAGLKATDSTPQEGWQVRQVCAGDGRRLLSLTRKTDCHEDEPWQVLMLTGEPEL